MHSVPLTLLHALMFLMHLLWAARNQPPWQLCGGVGKASRHEVSILVGLSGVCLLVVHFGVHWDSFVTMPAVAAW